MVDHKQIEHRALQISILGTLVLAALGIFFAVQSGSQAILLDGLFSALGFFMALMTLYVSQLVRRPDDDIFQYGYAHFAPLMNVLKAVVTTALCLFALVSAINTIRAGGRHMAVGSAVIYATAATIIGLGLFVYLRKAAQNSGSVLVALDAESARLGMFLSAAVLAGFALGWFSMGTALEHYVNYLDSAVVLALCLVSLPTPLILLWQNGREVLLMAPDQPVQEAIVKRIESAIADVPFSDHRIRMVKLGNVLSITLHLQPADEAQPVSISDLDRIRRAIETSLSSISFDVGIDVVFVSDMQLAR